LAVFQAFKSADNVIRILVMKGGAESDDVHAHFLSSGRAFSKSDGEIPREFPASNSETGFRRIVSSLVSNYS
jgi:hypothetical protein